MVKAGEKIRKTWIIKNALMSSVIASFGLVALPSAEAAVYYWDADGDASASMGGAGTWDASSVTWRKDSSTGALSPWANTDADQSVFGGTAGTITLNADSAPVVANKLTFSVSGYVIAAPSAGTATLNLSGNSPTIEVTTAGHTATISAQLSGSGSLTKIGAGTLELSGANTYSGGTTLSSGTLRLSGSGTSFAGALGTGLVTVTGAATITESTTATSIANNINVQSGASLTLSAATADQTFAGNISGSGSITTTASSNAYYVTNLSGDNSGFSGTLTTSSNSRSRFKFGSANSGSASASWSLNNATAGGIAMTFGNGTLELGALSGNGFIRSEGANGTTSVLKIGGKGIDSTFTGKIQWTSGKTVSVVKVGAGSLTLTNSSNYSGDTTISGGALILAASDAIIGTSGVTINGGTLASSVQSATVGIGGLTITSGAINANQAGVGAFVIAAGKNVSLAGGTLYETIASASSYDTISTAAGSPGSISMNNMTMDLSSSAGIDYGATYNLFTNFASVSVSGVMVVGYDTVNYTAALSDAGALSFTVIPEPASLNILALAVIGVFAIRRKS